VVIDNRLIKDQYYYIKEEYWCKWTWVAIQFYSCFSGWFK